MLVSCVAHIRNDKEKTEQSLAEHLLAVAHCAEGFASSAGLPTAGFLLGILHDYGKYSTLFQQYIRLSEGLIDQDHDAYVDYVSHKGRIDHSTAGAQLLWTYFKKNPKCRPYAQILALCIASHHSGLIDCVTPDGEHTFLKRMEKSDTATHLSECKVKNDISISEIIAEKLSPHVIKELHTVLMSIQTRHTHNSFQVQKALLTRFLLSCLVDADHTDSADFENPQYAQHRSLDPLWASLCQRMEEHLEKLPAKYDIDKVRQDISQQCAHRAKDAQGLFTLSVPTGGGKTLASLRFALHHAKKHKLERIIYIIPYTSIIEQNADVVRRILESDDTSQHIVLEHHSNILPKNDSWKNQLLASTWDAPIVFTTMVQFLETLFGTGTRSVRRMHNLTRSVLIFDEIQTLPVRCIRLFCQAINFLVHTGSSSVVLCTATQPRLGTLPRPELGSLQLSPEQEIIQDSPSLFKTLQRVKFFDHCDTPYTATDIAALCLAEIQRTGSCLIVCNTKKWAEKLYTLCRNEKPTWEIYYLSTNLCPAHRLDQLESMTAALAQKKPVICVSTQLIECGVDISFGSVIRFAAGLDSLLQSAGRCNRHGECGKDGRGRVHIVTVAPGEENLQSLPDIQEGQRVFLERIRFECAQLLKEKDYDMTLPELVERYFEHYYYARHGHMSYPLEPPKFIRNDSMLNILGSNDRATHPLKDGLLPQSFASAARAFEVIGAPTQGIIIPYGDGKAIIADLNDAHSLLYRKKDILRKAQRYTVNVYPHTLNELKRNNAIRNIHESDIWELKEQYYSHELGVTLQPQHSLEALCL